MTTIYGDKTYLACAETAKFVRAALRDAFPGVKFSVRSDTYSMGASIRVKWTDGPRAKRVNRIIKRFEGADFDGMIDLKTYNEHWLLPDGTVTVARIEGTTGSIAPEAYPAPHPAARRVHFGADFIDGNREITDYDTKVAEAEQEIRAQCVIKDDRFGEQWVDNLARNMVYDRDEDEANWIPALRRVVFREDD